jgi:CTP:molybdopterin cytidylyltransferase MocA
VIAAAVLAAGSGERMGGDTPKPLVALHGKPLVSYALDAASSAALQPVLVVVGNAADEVVRVVPRGAEVVRNEQWRTGIASSLGAALRALVPRRDVAAVVVGLADQPFVGADAYRRVAAAYHDGARLAAATYGGERRNPVLLAREHWDEALTLTGDEGARTMFRRHVVVDVPCDDTGSPADVDTPADLRSLEG